MRLNKIIILLIIFNSSFAKVNQNDSTNYFPLQIGNIWNYKYTEADSIFALPHKIFGTISVSDTIYFKYGDVEEYPYLIRADSLGRIVHRIDNKEVVWFDFTNEDSSYYEYKPFPNDHSYLVLVRKNISIMTYLGMFENCIEFFFDDTTIFDDEQWYTFAPEIGIVRIQQASVNILLASAIINDKIIVNVEGKSSRPLNYSLNQNYPNPFNSETKISYSIQNTGLVTLKIYDIRGREITTLVNEIHSSGKYEIIFDAVNLPSGLYSYRLTCGDFIQTRKFILIR